MINAIVVSLLLAMSFGGMAARAKPLNDAAQEQLARDALIENTIKFKFAQQQAFGLPGIRVHCENAVVHLNGSLVTQDAIALAMRLASATPGVAAVFNDIRLAQ